MFVDRVVVLAFWAVLQATLMNLAVPLVRPALSAWLPVFVLVPTYTDTELVMMPVPPSLSLMTTVLIWANGLARAFSHAPTPVSPEPLVLRLNLPRT